MQDPNMNYGNKGNSSPDSNKSNGLIEIFFVYRGMLKSNL